MTRIEKSTGPENCVCMSFAWITKKKKKKKSSRPFFPPNNREKKQKKKIKKKKKKKKKKKTFESVFDPRQLYFASPIVG